MKLRTAFLALCVLLSSAVVAHADDVKVRDHRTNRKPKVVKPVWDTTGWTSLGSRTVQGKRDRDTIPVGVKDGKFSKITLVVEDSDLELFDLVIHFGNGETYSPATRHYFKEGSRTGVIDLPGEARYIKKVVFKYGNLPRRGKASIQLWGFAVIDPPPPPPPPFTWENKGWQLLGERQVQGKKDKDTILVGAYEGKFDQLTFVVADSDVEMQKVVVHFVSGKKMQLRFKHVFKEGSRTGVIDLPGNDRSIKKIDLKYKNVAGGGRATVQVWGRDTRPAVVKPSPEPPDDIKVRDHRTERLWDDKGWTMLGEQEVNGANDFDNIVVKSSAKFQKLTVVVLDSDLVLDQIEVAFRKGKSLEVDVGHAFKEGSRTRAIDLPGDKRHITQIVLKYGNLAGGGRAKVQVWGK